MLYHGWCYFEHSFEQSPIPPWFTREAQRYAEHEALRSRTAALRGELVSGANAIVIPEDHQNYIQWFDTGKRELFM